jgi:hypothetical protein
MLGSGSRGKVLVPNISLKKTRAKDGFSIFILDVPFYDRRASKALLPIWKRFFGTDGFESFFLQIGLSTRPD